MMLTTEVVRIEDGFFVLCSIAGNYQSTLTA